MKTQTHNCPIEACSKSFDQEEALDEHIATHKDSDEVLDKDFKCPNCDRIMATKQSLREHTYTHTGKKPFKCLVSGCGKTFRQSSQLCNHKKVHKEAQMMMKRQAEKQKQLVKKSQETVGAQSSAFEIGFGKNLKITLPPIIHPALGSNSFDSQKKNK